MKLSQFIIQLHNALREHGDLEVEVYNRLDAVWREPEVVRAGSELRITSYES